MTLTLDEVKSIRFPMAKRPNEGYRASEVDNFVDKVELAFAEFTEENDRLTKQVESLQAGGEQTQYMPVADADHDPEEVERLRGELDQAHRAIAEHQAETDRLRDELERSRQAVQADGDERVAAINQEVDRLRAENADARRQQAEAQQRVADRDQQIAQLQAELQQARSAQVAEPVAPQSVVTEQGVQQLTVTTSAEASPAVVRLVQLATEQAENVVNEAQAEATRKLDDAAKRAHEMTSSAQSRADQIVGEAQVRAERLRSEAEAGAAKTTTDAQNEANRLVSDAEEHAAQLHSQTEDRRRELFTQLENDRDVLAGKVTRLRDFEENYRSTLTERLHLMLEELDHTSFDEENKPVLLDELHQSSTPRLDALLANNEKSDN